MGKKILAILVVVAAVLLLFAAFADPAIRYRAIGVELERDLVKLQGTDPMTVMLSLETGTELIPADQLDAEPAIQDEYSLLMILAEEFQAQNKSAAVTYSVDQMESEQWAWKQAKLNELKAKTEVTPRALATAPKLTISEESIMASSQVWTPLITSFWPKLPEGLNMAKKASWQEQISTQSKHPLSGEMTKVNYNLLYQLDQYVNTDHGMLVNIKVIGSIAEGSDVDESVEVRGTFKGFILIEPETGRAYGGEYRIDEKFMVKQPGLPVLRKSTFQGARFWRPMFYKMSNQKMDAGTESGEGEAAPEAAPTTTPEGTSNNS